MKLFYLLAGGAVLTAIATPYLLKIGTEKVKETLENLEYDPQTRTIRRKDENVIILEEKDYHIEHLDK